jgi:hypothetical protein
MQLQTVETVESSKLEQILKRRTRETKVGNRIGHSTGEKQKNTMTIQIFSNFIFVKECTTKANVLIESDIF